MGTLSLRAARLPSSFVPACAVGNWAEPWFVDVSGATNLPINCLIGWGIYEYVNMNIKDARYYKSIEIN